MWPGCRWVRRGRYAWPRLSAAAADMSERLVPTSSPTDRPARSCAKSSICSTEARASEPSHRAREVLAEFESAYGYTGEIPVPVEQIADSLARLRVLDVDDMSHVQGA